VRLQPAFLFPHTLAKEVCSNWLKFFYVQMETAVLDTEYGRFALWTTMIFPIKKGVFDVPILVSETNDKR